MTVEHETVNVQASLTC